MDSEFDSHVSLANLLLNHIQNRRGWTSEGQKIVIANITAESQKTGYNPETDTNWCHMPMELREECIKEMDFKTRTHMRASSSIEKSFVDAHVYHFDKLIFQSTPFITLKLVKSDPLHRGEQIILCRDHLRKIPPFKFCDFQEIQCHATYRNLPDVLNDWESKCAPFRFKTLRCTGGNFEIYKYFLKNSWDGVEELFLDIKHRQYFEIGDVLCPSFAKATKIFFENVPLDKVKRVSLDIAKSWFEYGVKIGTICHVHSGKIGQPMSHGTMHIKDTFRLESHLLVLEGSFEDGLALELISRVLRHLEDPNGN